MEKHAHSSMTRTRKAKGRDDFVHLLQRVHRTETRKVAEKVAMTEALKEHQHLVVKSPSGKANSQLCTNFLKGSCPKGEFMYFWHVPECTQIKAPGGCQFGVCSQTHSKTWCWKKNCIDWYSHSIKWWATDATTEKSVGWQDPIPSETSSSREQIRSQEKETGPYIWSHPDWISKSAKFKRSNILRKICRMDLEHGRKSKDSSLDFTQERILGSRFLFWQSK